MGRAAGAGTWDKMSGPGTGHEVSRVPTWCPPPARQTAPRTVDRMSPRVLGSLLVYEGTTPKPAGYPAVGSFQWLPNPDGVDAALAGPLWVRT